MSISRLLSKNLKKFLQFLLLLLSACVIFFD